MRSSIHIEVLQTSDKENIQTIAEWYWNEWNTPQNKTVRRLTGQPDEGVVRQFIASYNNQLVATVGLCDEVSIFNEYPDFKKYTPWVGLLYTHQDFRNKGIGELLLKYLEVEALGMEIPNIYLYTFTAEAMYQRCGWLPMKKIEYKEHETVLMYKSLKRANMRLVNE